MRVASNLLWMLAERGLQVGGGIAIVAIGTCSGTCWLAT